MTDQYLAVSLCFLHSFEISVENALCTAIKTTLSSSVSDLRHSIAVKYTISAPSVEISNIPYTYSILKIKY